MLSLLFALSLAEEEGPGIHSHSGEFLPLLPISKVKGVALLLDYKDKKIPIQRLFRVVSAYSVQDDEAYGLAGVFGQIVNVNDATDFIWNFTSYGVGGRLSSEDQTTFSHFCELDTGLDASSYVLNLWAQVTAENGRNYSVQLFSDVVTFEEVVDIKVQIGSVILYALSFSAIAYVIYRIVNKEKAVKGAEKKKEKSKSQIKDYNDEVGVTKEQVKRVSSNGRLSGSPARGKSPGKGK